MINNIEQKLEPFQERMIKEFYELEDRLNKLSNFIQNNSLFQKLELEEREDLINQLKGMEIYYKSLKNRCLRQKLL